MPRIRENMKTQIMLSLILRRLDAVDMIVQYRLTFLLNH